MSIFDPLEGPCGIFAPAGCGQSLMETFTVMRAASLVLGTAPAQNTAGEVLLSFVAIGQQTMEQQPVPAGFTRMKAGQLVQVSLMHFGIGWRDIQEGDRATIDGRQLEVLNALHYGNETTEVEWQHIGR